jgi:hypothetical protein
MRYSPPPQLHALDEPGVWMSLVVGQESAQGIGRQHAIVLDQEHVLTGLDQLVDLVVDKRDAAPARIDAELPALVGYCLGRKAFR